MLSLRFCVMMIMTGIQLGVTYILHMVDTNIASMSFRDFWDMTVFFILLTVIGMWIYCKQDVQGYFQQPLALYNQATQAGIKNLEDSIKKITQKKQVLNKQWSWLQIGLIVLAVGSCLGTGVMVSYNHTPQDKEEQQILESNPVDEIKQKMDNTYPRSQTSDVAKYSINGIALEDSWRSVKDKLGTPLSSSDEDIYTRYKYPDLEVVVDRNNIVQAVVSLTSSGATKGVAVGDSLRDVVRQYGKDYAQSDYDDLTLYEYSFDTPTGKPALFRFAVNKSDQKVSYMSVRTLSDDVVKARNVFLDYHKAISAHNFNAAYSDLSQEMQANSGDISSFSKGFETTLSSNVSRLHVVSVYPTSITFAYELEAEDRGPGLSRQTQRFNGTVTMIVENGQWKIGDMEAKKK